MLHMNKGNGSSLVCPLCSNNIRILQGNYQYSLDVHMQAAHSTSQAMPQTSNSNQRFQGQQNNRRRGRQNQNFSGRGNERRGNPRFLNNFSLSRENVSSLESDMNYSQGQHARSDDQSSTSSGRSSHRRNDNLKINLESKEQSTLSEAVLSVFKTMPMGQKFHRGFINEDADGEPYCNKCKVKIEPISSIPEHLMKKTHGDSVIQAIKDLLSPDLWHVLEFISFNYSGNLCCNLCSCKIHLCSFNLHETVINIMAHNASQAHLSKKSTTDSNQSDEASKLLKSLSFVDKLVGSSIEFIDCRMEPQFECKICCKKIEYSKNKEVLLKNFISHLSSAGHNKCFNATKVLNLFSSSNVQYEGNHKFVVVKGSISCIICKTTVEAYLPKLHEHVQGGGGQQPKLPPVMNIPGIRSAASLSINAPISEKVSPLLTHPVRSNIRESVQESNLIQSELRTLLNSLPQRFKNVNYIVESGKSSVTCLICNCIIPAFPYNLQTHLEGNNHTKNELSLTNQDCSPNKETQKNPTLLGSVASLNLNSSGTLLGKSSVSQHESSKDINSRADFVLNSIKKSDTFIKNAAKCLVVLSDNYICSLCKTTIPKSVDENILKHSLLEHFSGKMHKQLYSERQEAEMSQLLRFDPLVREHRQYLSKEGGNINCILCNTSMSISIDGMKLKKNLESHLTGKVHVDKVLEKTQNPQKQQSFPTASSAGSVDLVVETFKKLPVELQREIIYIKSSSRIEGFLHCTLCSSEIHPPNLKDHLQKDHISGKGASRELSNKTFSQQTKVAEENFNFRQNQGALKSLFDNIDEKFSNFLSRK